MVAPASGFPDGSVTVPTAQGEQLGEEIPDGAVPGPDGGVPEPHAASAIPATPSTATRLTLPGEMNRLNWAFILSSVGSEFGSLIQVIGKPDIAVEPRARVGTWDRPSGGSTTQIRTDESDLALRSGSPRIAASE